MGEWIESSDWTDMGDEGKSTYCYMVGGISKAKVFFDYGFKQYLIYIFSQGDFVTDQFNNINDAKLFVENFVSDKTK